MSCIERTNTLETPSVDSSCLAGIYVDLTTALRFAAENVLGDAGISQLNPVLIVSAIAVFAIVAMASARVRSDLKPNEQFWLVYGAVAFFSIYLTLSTILAVPLLSEDTSDPPRPAEDLRSSLEPMIPNSRIAPTRYPGSQQSLREVIPESVSAGQDGASGTTYAPGPGLLWPLAERFTRSCNRCGRQSEFAPLTATAVAQWLRSNRTKPVGCSGYRL